MERGGICTGLICQAVEKKKNSISYNLWNALDLDFIADY